MAPLNELADLLYEAARDIQNVARVFSLAGNQRNVNTMGRDNVRISSHLVHHMQTVGLPVLAAMKWNEHKLEALRHALAIEEATK